MTHYYIRFLNKTLKRQYKPLNKVNTTSDWLIVYILKQNVV